MVTVWERHGVRHSADWYQHGDLWPHMWQLLLTRVGYCIFMVLVKVSLMLMLNIVNVIIKQIFTEYHLVSSHDFVLVLFSLLLIY